MLKRQGIQKAIQIGDLMVNLKPLCKTKKIYMSKMKEVTHWSPKYINFILELFQFVKIYPRLFYTTFSLLKVKQNFIRIRELIGSLETSDRDIWKVNPGQCDI